MQEEIESAVQQERKRRLKKLVYSNLVGASLLSVVGFSASAHGNASSHTPKTSVAWNLDEFTVGNSDTAATDAAKSEVATDETSTK